MNYEIRLRNLIGRQKKLITGLVISQNKDSMGYIERVAKEICLVVADFKCQACGNEHELQYHHLIMRKNKEYMDFFRYATQRYYWANIIILCKNHHNKIHEFVEGKKMEEDVSIIPEETIKKLKEKWL